MAAGIHEIEVFKHIMTTLAHDGSNDTVHATISAKFARSKTMNPGETSRFLARKGETNLEKYIRGRTNGLRTMLFPLRVFKKHGQSWYPFLRIVPATSKPMGSIDAIESFRLLLFSTDPMGVVDANGEQRIVGIGLRFDVPHTPAMTGAVESLAPEMEGEGAHDYFHAQCIVGFDRGDDPFEGIPHWLPVTQPAIPLPKSDSGTQLLLCVVLSLYGYRSLGEAMRELAPSVQDPRRKIVMELLDRAGRPGKAKGTP